MNRLCRAEIHFHIMCNCNKEHFSNRHIIDHSQIVSAKQEHDWGRVIDERFEFMNMSSVYAHHFYLLGNTQRRQ